MLISHDLEGIHAYCFRCREYWFTPHGTQSISDLLKRQEEYSRRLQDTQELVLPDDYTKDIPLKHAVWFMRKGIRYEVAQAFKFGYSPSMNRIVIPVYEDGKLVNLQLRACDAQTPKVITPLAYKFPSALFWAELPRLNDETCVVVEDVLSAIKIGQWRNCVALLGTNMSDGRAFKIAQKYSRVIVWLDGDKAGFEGRIKAQRKLELMGVDVRHIGTDKDPKEYSRKDAITLIQGAESRD